MEQEPQLGRAEPGDGVLITNTNGPHPGPFVFLVVRCEQASGARGPTGIECGGAIFGLATGAVGQVASGIGVVAGAPTVVLEPAAAAGFAVSAGGVAYSVSDVVEPCG